MNLYKDRSRLFLRGPEKVHFHFFEFQMDKAREIFRSALKGPKSTHGDVSKSSVVTHIARKSSVISLAVPKVKSAKFPLSTRPPIIFISEADFTLWRAQR